MANVRHEVGDQKVGNILKGHGIEPTPERQRPTSWATFLKAHWETLTAVNFTTTEIWTARRLVTMFVLVVIHFKTRRIEIARVIASPNGEWVKQVARELTDSEDRFLRNTSHLLIDRDTKFLPLRDFLKNCTNITPVVLPPRSPNCNAHIERYMRSPQSECLNRMIFFGEGSLRTALKEFEAHYHSGRNHQGLDNKMIDPGPEVGSSTGPIHCQERLGRLLRYYHREAA